MTPTHLPEAHAENEHPAVSHLRRRIAEGVHWYIALLEAVGQWDRPAEEYRGRRFEYLIDNEAFDWLVLAERLLDPVLDLCPADEVEALLFEGRPPIEVSDLEFRRLIGPAKYRAHLNYLYGVSVEEALQLATLEKLEKERRSLVYCAARSVTDDEVFIHIYGRTERELWTMFWQEQGLGPPDQTSITGLKRFTYWLFKYRLRHSDRERLAADTRLGLETLERHRARRLAVAGLNGETAPAGLVVDAEAVATQ